MVNRISCVLPLYKQFWSTSFISRAVHILNIENKSYILCGNPFKWTIRHTVYNNKKYFKRDVVVQKVLIFFWFYIYNNINSYNSCFNLLRVNSFFCSIIKWITLYSISWITDQLDAILAILINTRISNCSHNSQFIYLFIF